MLYNLSMENIYDVIIVGGGPAGLSAGIYAARANLNTLIIEASSEGGKLVKISSIENYPGFKSISGFELANNLVEQAKEFNVEFVNNEVIKIIDHTVILKDKTKLQAKAIVIATGSKERKLDLEKANEFIGKGISYCATCDGFFFKNKPVCVIAENTNALQESLYLANLVSKVTMITKRDNLLGDQVIIDSILNNPRIELITNVYPTRLIIKDDKLVGLNIKDSDNVEREIECFGIFPYISFNPSTDFLDSTILNEKGFIVVDRNFETSISGIYAIGDCIEKDLRQVVTACADGAIAASSIIKTIKKWGYPHLY